MPDEITRDEARALFGRAAVAYDTGRPGYPDAVFELLAERSGLAEGCHTLEVGAGAGQATRRLAEFGARPLVAVEPDRGFADELELLARTSGGAVVPVFEPFETAMLPERTFDLAVSATAFHWLDPREGPRKLGACLRPGGWLALFWNVFGDPRSPDPFHDATAALLAGQAISPSQGAPGKHPFSMQREARRADFQAAGACDEFSAHEFVWTLHQTPEQIRALYATFSPVARLPDADRERLLDALATVAEREFNGRVERRMVTPVYIGRRAD